MGGDSAQAINITDTTASTNKTTGALKVAGGVGVVGNVYVGENVDVGENLTVSSNLEVGTANLFVDTTTGRVGIGVTNPTYELHMDGNMRIDNGGSIILYRSDTTGGPSLMFRNPDDSVSGWFGFGSSSKNQFRMVTNNNYPLTFWTSATGSGVERMRIAPDGNVGIGTTSPLARLDVQGTGAAPLTSHGTTTAIMRTRATNTNVVLDQGALPSSPWSYWMQVSDSTNLGLEYPLALNPNGGNVGIGTTNPGATLDVNGIIKNQNPSWNLYMQGSPTPTTSGTLEFNNTKASGINCTLNTGSPGAGLTSRVTITVAGRYFIGFQAFTENTVTATTSVNCRININGSEYVRSFHVQPITNFSAMGGMGCVADLSVNDYVEIYSSQDIHYNGNGSFYGFMIG